ncbi:carbon-nitrogen hydrolase family protein [Brevibacillus massiliensis]|uniref:carbon-nitrogen hydrolase family protein n=1 Tax=Brevibacillus massiliensis TaxID=1118054 RepID=UPI00031FB1D6|nr:carbon-nitrogen hydrolase family protein [Brevibacillus massiliensis]
MSLTTTLNVAAIQMNCLPGDKAGNLRKAQELVERSIKQGAKLIVLPELFNTGYRVEENDDALAEPIPGDTTNWMFELCKQNNVYIIGCILEKSEIKGVVYDTAVVVAPQGIIGTYRKIYLWDAEKLRFGKGEEYPVFDLGIARVGIQICYEIGFPEGSRILSLKGADLIVYPSAFGKARLYAWDVATRSRALENGSFVIAVNRTGTEKDETTFGGCSRIVGPQGDILAEATEEDQVIVAALDLSLVTSQRRNIPYLRDINKTLVYNKELITE